MSKIASLVLPADGHDTSALDMPTLPAPDTNLELRSLQLNDDWRVGEPIPRQTQTHATVYSILMAENDQIVEDLEAHVFMLDHIQPGLRKHRLRCIKRMKSRTTLEFKVNRLIIIVITTPTKMDTKALERGARALASSPHGEPETDYSTKSTGKAKKKTQHQRESARIRQKERRQRKRSAKTRHRDDDGHEIAETIERGLDDWEQVFPTFVLLLWVLYSKTGPRTKITPEHMSLVAEPDFYESLNKYLNQQSSRLPSSSVEEMEIYLRIKRSECISLQRQQAKILRAEKYHSAKLDNLWTVRKQVHHPNIRVQGRALKTGQ